MNALQHLQRLVPRGQTISKLAPGIALCVAVVIAATALEPVVRWVLASLLGIRFTLPAIVIALLIGMACHTWALRPEMKAGVAWCAKPLLRLAVAFLGLRIALGDIAGLGFGTALIVIVGMAATLAVAIIAAGRLGCSRGYGALSGAANAVCGASATLATATVLPDYRNKEADIVFTVVMANAISTIVMVAYPPLCHLLGFSPRQTGIMLGATIHDMAQVVGAGYAVSEPVGDIAVVVKMFRVLLLLPVVLSIGWWIRSRETAGDGVHATAPPVPGFAIAFLVLCVVNSVLLATPWLKPLYLPVKQLLSQASAWGLLIAIGALGLGTSLDQLLKVDWRQLAVFVIATLVILVIGTAGAALLG